MRGRRTIVLAALASALTMCAPAAVAVAGPAPGQYRMFDLGTLGGATSRGVAINDRGQVVGSSDTADGAVHPFLWDGRMVDLGLRDGYRAGPTAVNNRGQVVGTSDVAGGVHAVLWQDGRIVDLGTLGGVLSAAYDINDRGQVVGVSVAGDEWHAFLWENGTMRDLGEFDAGSVNNRTQVAGAAGRAYEDEEVYPVMWYRGRRTVLSAEPGSAGGINNAGMITVNALRSDGSHHAFVWHRGRLTALPTLGGSAGAVDINDRGQVLGWSTTAGSTTPRSVLWSGTTIVDLTPRGVPADATVTSMNNRGDLVGTYHGHAVTFRR